tara:strand:- start:247 stop:360 length:114 start_codon:yes stop_codon:yes gene_type:complete
MLDIITPENARYIIYAKILFLIAIYTLVCIQLNKGDK